VDHKWIMGVFIAAFCIIFAGMLLYSLLFITDTVKLNREVLAFVVQNLVAIGGLMLSVSSAIGAFVVEDSYTRLGMLIFSALVTVFILIQKLPFYPFYS